MKRAEMSDREALHDLVSRYAHAIDSRDLDMLVDCFCEDSVAEYDGGVVLEGHASIRQFMDTAFRKGLGMTTPSTHMMANTLIDLCGGEATLRTSAIAVLTNRPGVIVMRGLRYTDLCVRDGGRWRFRKRRHEADWEFEAPSSRLTPPVLS
jgi:ketosteroid isomerase-like protein